MRFAPDSLANFEDALVGEPDGGEETAQVTVPLLGWRPAPVLTLPSVLSCGYVHPLHSLAVRVAVLLTQAVVLVSVSGRCPFMTPDACDGPSRTRAARGGSPWWQRATGGGSRTPAPFFWIRYTGVRRGQAWWKWGASQFLRRFSTWTRAESPSCALNSPPLLSVPLATRFSWSATIVKSL